MTFHVLYNLKQFTIIKPEAIIPDIHDQIENNNFNNKNHIKPILNFKFPGFFSQYTKYDARGSRRIQILIN